MSRVSILLVVSAIGWGLVEIWPKSNVDQPMEFSDAAIPVNGLGADDQVSAIPRSGRNHDEHADGRQAPGNEHNFSETAIPPVDILTLDEWFVESGADHQAEALAESAEPSRDGSTLVEEYYKAGYSEEKINILHRLWGGSPAIFEDDNVHTLLALAAYDENDQVKSIALKMQLDYRRMSGGESPPLIKLALQADQLDQVKNRSDYQGSRLGLHQLAITDINDTQYHQRKQTLVEELSEIALFSQDRESMFSALEILVDLDEGKVPGLITDLLLQSRDQEERIAYIEILRAGIGRFDSLELDQLFQSLQFDYNETVASVAQQSIMLLREYESEI